jgi:hypothetical protein
VCVCEGEKRKNQSSSAGLERSPTIVTKDKPVGYKKRRKKNKRRTGRIDHYHYDE